MIAVSPNLVRQVKYLIQQSTQGFHALFDHQAVKRVMLKVDSEPATVEEAYSVEPHLERVLELPTLARKHAYLEKLDPRTFELVVRTYFNIIENHILESKDSVKH